jgi:hypothetical protein
MVGIFFLNGMCRFWYMSFAACLAAIAMKSSVNQAKDSVVHDHPGAAITLGTHIRCR